jgi:hypothetical protein
MTITHISYTKESDTRYSLGTIWFYVPDSTKKSGQKAHNIYIITPAQEQRALRLVDLWRQVQR